jgi:opacity protein-like surface antigen
MILVCAEVAAGQAMVLRSGDRFAGVWGGASVYSPVGAHLGKTADRDLFLGAFHLERIMGLFDGLALSATADILPVVVVSNNPTYRVQTVTDSYGARTITVQTGRAPVYGAGLTPLGMKATSPSFRRARMYLGGGIGFLCFTRDTPVPESRRLNFTFEYGGGVQFARSVRQAIVVGYRFHHLSNAYTAPQNPGLDGNVFYVGLLQRR